MISRTKRSNEIPRMERTNKTIFNSRRQHILNNKLPKWQLQWGELEEEWMQGDLKEVFLGLNIHKDIRNEK